MHILKFILTVLMILMAHPVHVDQVFFFPNTLANVKNVLAVHTVLLCTRIIAHFALLGTLHIEEAHPANCAFLVIILKQTINVFLAQQEHTARLLVLELVPAFLALLD